MTPPSTSISITDPPTTPTDLDLQFGMVAAAVEARPSRHLRTAEVAVAQPCTANVVVEDLPVQHAAQQGSVTSSMSGISSVHERLLAGSYVPMGWAVLTYLQVRSEILGGLWKVATVA